MGPWLHICPQCGVRNYFTLSQMVLPELLCPKCGFAEINPPEVRQSRQKMLNEHIWYAGFMELLLAMEEELAIAYADADFPQPFVTWRRLLEVTLQYAGTAVTEEQVMEIMARFANITAMDIRKMLDEPVRL